MTIKNALNLAISSYNAERKALECELLLAHLLKKDRIFLHTNIDFALPSDIREAFFKGVESLKNYYPLEYLTNKVSFYSREFFIKEGVLIPRPESELLVEHTLDLIAKYNIKNIYEIGVGSGILSIMLCLLNKNINIIASDISKVALEVAETNIERFCDEDSSLKSRIRLICCNLLDEVSLKDNALIISNPPYIANNYKIPPKLSYEPKEALFGGEVGDEILLKIIELDSTFLSCEIGYNQGYLEQYLKNYKYIRFYDDYAGFRRGFVASKI